MDIRLLGDYYDWYCDWCDSRNLTLWKKFEESKVTCGACHKSFSSPAHTAEGEHFALAGGF